MDFNQIIFDKQYHTYTLNGHRLKSVTKAVYTLKPPFDPDGSITAKKAAEINVTPEQMRAIWEGNRQASMDRGSRVHDEIRQILLGQEVNDDFTTLSELPEVAAFRTVQAEMARRQMVIEPGYVEWVVGDEELGLAGTIDALVYAQSTKQYHLVDWKTGTFTTYNKFARLLPPFDDLDDCYFSTYNLQMSLYRLMVERNTDLPVGNSYLYHLGNDGSAKVHQVVDLRERAAEWVKGL